MMGSGVFAKAFTLEHAYAAKDSEGKSVKDEFERIGYIGDEEPGAHPIGSYFETHIEQGPVLEDHGKTIGVVTGVLGIRWYDCTVTGMEAHAGPTPMALRKDALQVAAALMQEVVACAHRHPPHGRGTVGMVQRAPRTAATSSPAVSSSASTCATPATRCARRWTPTSAPWPPGSVADSGLPIVIEQVSAYPAQPFHTDCVDAVQRAAHEARLLNMPAVSRGRPRRRVHGAAGAGRA
jgi:beta-ureidopropionase / N-carbamoyl-L-amino-acid hydrolase